MRDRMTSHFGCKRNGPPDSEVRTVGEPYRVRPPSEKDPHTGYHLMVEQVHDHPSPGKWRIDPGGRSVADGRPLAHRPHPMARALHLGRAMPKASGAETPEPKSSEPNVLLGSGLKTLDRVYRVGYTPDDSPSER